MDPPRSRRDTRFNTMIPYEQQQQQSMGLGLQSNGLASHNNAILCSGIRPIHLNVGGKYYVTLVETIGQVKSSYFENFLRLHPASGKFILYRNRCIEDQGTIFINRDGELFRYVLQYMRDGQNTVLPEDIPLLKQLVREADFFGIERYKEMLQMEINDLTRQREDRENGLIALRNNTTQIAHILYQQPFKK